MSAKKITERTKSLLAAPIYDLRTPRFDRYYRAMRERVRFPRYYKKALNA